MNNCPLIVSYYTPDAYYKSQVARLKNSLKKFKLKNKVQCLAAQGTWMANCHQKAEFVLSKLLEEKQDIVWLDADAEIVSYPELFEEITGDVAAHRHKGELINGATLLFRNKPNVVSLVKSWIDQNEKTPRDNDQQNLHKVIDEYVSKKLITFEDLPFTYARIFDYPSDEEAIILQHQASRKGSRIYAEAPTHVTV
jgi:hypothetical protein